jgi:hypothetical protein
MPDFAEMPPYSTSIGAVTFGSTAITRGFSSTQRDNAGGFGATSAPGGLLVQAPGNVLPMLWHRGSMFNLGLFTRIGTLPPLGAFDYFTGDNALWWDAPQSWGRQNYLIRRPRTLIINDQLNIAEAWVNANYNTVFAPLNVSVCVIDQGNFSSFALGIPFSSSNTTQTADFLPGISVTYSMPVTDERKYVGGDCFVAHLQGDILSGFNLWGALGSSSAYTAINSATGGSPSPAPPLTQFVGHDSTTPTSTTLVGTLNFTKAANDIAALAAGAAKFNTFQMVLYQYNQNPYSSANLLTLSGGLHGPITPDPIVPSSNADTLLTGAGTLITRKGTFTVGDSTTMLAQLLTDAVAFFPALP